MKIVTVFWILLKQAINNWKLELVIFVGLVLAVGVVSSIAIYSEGSLQSALIERWELFSSQRNPPGTFRVVNEQWKEYHPIFSQGRPARDGESLFAEFSQLDSFLRRELPARFGTEQLQFSVMGQLERLRIRPVEPDGVTAHRWADIRYVSNLEPHVRLIEGDWPEREWPGKPTPVPVAVDRAMVDRLELAVGRVYQYPLTTPAGQAQQFLPIIVTGIYAVLDESYHQPIWTVQPPFESSFMVNKEVFNQLAVRDDTQVYQYIWHWVFDHDDIRVHQISLLVRSLRQLQTQVGQISDNVAFRTSPLNTLSSFTERANVVGLLLLILSLPVMGMILYYVLLAAGMAVRRRRNEIAMLKSRGAGVMQILLSFGMEWAFLCAAALLIGPWIGLFIARVMGSSAGFLSFVGRAPLPAVVSPTAVYYGLAAMALAWLGCLFQVVPATRHSIVSYKRDMARGTGVPLWQRYYLDFALLAVCWYGYRMLHQQILYLTQRGTVEAELLLDPLLFLVPVVFLITFGLLTLRIFPYVIRILAFFVHRLANVSLAITLRQFQRDPGRYSPLMLFILLTVALGIYGASIARTLDQNYIDSIMYAVGSDVSISSQWVHGTSTIMDYGFENPDELMIDERPQIAEPPFYVHKEMPGVVDAARVFRMRTQVSRLSGGQTAPGTLMAIDPHDFAHVAWDRRDLSDQHMFHYLNALIYYAEAALISREAFELAELSMGDWLSVVVPEGRMEVFVAGVIDLWPSVQPNEFPLLVVNLEYLESNSLLRPYDVWLRLEPDAEIAAIVSGLQDEGIYVTRIRDTRNQIVEGRRDPQRMGLFGMLTIVFVVSVLITIIGFFLYTFLSLKERMLQFGVLRAMGLSLGQLGWMLGLEQVLSVGVALVLGALFGAIGSHLFIPFMQITQDISGVVPNFLVVVDPIDIIGIFAVVGVTLVIGMVILAFVLKRMSLHQAIKLGEEV